MTARYVAALDQGTTSSRCLLFDRAGSVVAVAQQEHRQITPRPGWVEHDPEQIWQATLSATQQALAAAADVGLERPTSIGITNQRENAVLWDRRSLVAPRHAIVWQDRRTTQTCDELREAGHEPRIAELLHDKERLGEWMDTVPDYEPYEAGSEAKVKKLPKKGAK